jgi:hypothetical protein
MMERTSESENENLREVKKISFQISEDYLNQLLMEEDELYFTAQCDVTEVISKLPVDFVNDSLVTPIVAINKNEEQSIIAQEERNSVEEQSLLGKRKSFESAESPQPISGELSLTKMPAASTSMPSSCPPIPLSL